MVAKQICPYCSKEFVNLSRHKCKLKKTNSSSSTTKNSSKSKKSSAKDQNTSNSNDKAQKNNLKSTSKRRGYSEIDKEVFETIKQNKSFFFDELFERFSNEDSIDEKNLEKSLHRLQNKQKITVISDVREGIRKDRIDYIEEYEIKDKNTLPKKGDLSSWEILDDCPCFLCPEIIKCNIGNNSFSDATIDKDKSVNTNPYYCEYLKSWINCKINDPPLEYKSPFKGGIYLDKKKKKKAKAEAKV